MIHCKTLYVSYPELLCLKVVTELENMKKMAIYWTPHWVGDPNNSMFEVSYPLHSKCITDISKQTCYCRLQDLFSIPCQHVMAVLGYNNDRPKDFVYSQPRGDITLLTYKRFIELILSEVFWERSSPAPVVPPFIRRMLGRLKKQRKNGT